jgi:hypothetical protein
MLDLGRRKLSSDQLGAGDDAPLALGDTGDLGVAGADHRLQTPN